VTNAAFAAADARIVGTFAATGMADPAIYAASIGALGTLPNCTVVLDREVQVLGEFGEVIGFRTVAAFLRSEVSPAVGGALRIGAETWTLEKKSSEDESLSEWVLNG
jgi:predicted naringenin-chalcone synthase